MSRLSNLPQDLLLHQLKYFSARELARLSVTSKYFNQVCMDESLWSNVCRSYGVMDLGIWPGKTFRSLYYLLLSKWGWLIGLWFGNFPTIGDLVHIVWRPEEGKLVAFRVDCLNAFNMRMELLSLNPNILAYELHTSFKYRMLFTLGLDTTASDILTLCRYPDLLTRVNDSDWPPLDIQNEIDLTHCHNASITEVCFYPHPGTGLWTSLPEQWESDSSSQENPPTYKRPCFSWRCERHCHECSRFQVRMFVPSLAKLFSYEIHPTSGLPLRGLWVGTYGPHGCEVLLFTYDKKKSLLLASKITGDVNVPRGEMTFLVNLGEELTKTTNNLFSGSRVYSGQGQIASNGFLNNRMIDIEFIWVSNDEIVVYWCDLHIMGRYLRVMDDLGQFVSRVSTPLTH